MPDRVTIVECTNAADDLLQPRLGQLHRAIVPASAGPSAAPRRLQSAEVNTRRLRSRADVIHRERASPAPFIGRRVIGHGAAGSDPRIHIPLAHQVRSRSRSKISRAYEDPVGGAIKEIQQRRARAHGVAGPLIFRLSDRTGVLFIKPFGDENESAYKLGLVELVPWVPQA